MVEHPGHPHKQLPQLLQGLHGEPLPVPVDVVVAQPHGKQVHLICRQLPPGQGVDLLQVLLSGLSQPLHVRLLCDVSHSAPPSVFSAWAWLR